MNDLEVIKRIRERTGATPVTVSRLWNVLQDEDKVISVLEARSYENLPVEVYILNYKLEQALKRIEQLENLYGNKEHNTGDKA